MAELVIDRLEIIEIDKNQPEAGGILASRIQDVLSLRGKQSSVRKPGEVVML
jgi:hypothetical protein